MMNTFPEDGTKETSIPATDSPAGEREERRTRVSDRRVVPASKSDPDASTCPGEPADSAHPEIISVTSSFQVVEEGPVPDCIGPYEVREVLGKGGMGIVYLAEQREPKRLIALKTIHPGRASDTNRKRFFHEAQILAHLQHPYIAQIYEAGNTQIEGRETAYFAMEYVEGLPLDDYVETHTLAISQRLDLMAHICDAVQYAHQKGVIHRDLKPSNIMVEAEEVGFQSSAQSGRYNHTVGRPKILDFGIARMSTLELNDTAQTNTGQIIGTLNYMSPEQASGGAHLVDTRSDVYSLGVILYKILSGQLPYQLDTGVAALLTIKNVAPTCISQHEPNLRGDIEIIVSRALEKEMDRRYQSPGELAADIRRYLHNEPILARRSGSWYHIRKFAMRRRGLVASLIGMVLLLIAGIIGTTTGMERAHRASVIAKKEAEVARQAREVADREARAAHVAQVEADQVSEFLVSLFTDADPFDLTDPDRPRGENMTARQLIDRGVEKIRIELTDQPGTRIRVLNTLGRVYSSLTLLKEAEPLLFESVELSRSINGPSHIDTVQSERSLGRLLEHLTEYDAALQAYQRSYEGAVKGFGDSHYETIMSRQSIAKLYLTIGETGIAESMLAENLERAHRVLGPKHQLVADTVNAMAWLYYNQGNVEKAESLFRKAAEIGRLRFGGEGDASASNNPNMAIVLANLAWVLVKQDKIVEGEQTISEAIDIFGKTLPAGHWRMKNAQSVLGSIRTRQRRFLEAEQLLLSSYPIIKETTGERSPYSRVMRERLVYLYTQWNKPREAAHWEGTPLTNH